MLYVCMVARRANYINLVNEGSFQFSICNINLNMEMEMKTKMLNLCSELCYFLNLMKYIWPLTISLGRAISITGV